jgi:hypothetical protein
MSRRIRQLAVGAHAALPAAYAGMLLIGTAAAALHGRFSATGVLVTVAILVLGELQLQLFPARDGVEFVGDVLQPGISRTGHCSTTAC